MSNKIPLHEAIRPRGDRDQSGSSGEVRHQLADILEAREDLTMVESDVSVIEIANTLKTISLSTDHATLQQQVIEILETSATAKPMTLGERLAQDRHV